MSITFNLENYFYINNNSLSKEICNDMINFFELDELGKYEGVIRDGVRKDVKDTLDFQILPKNKNKDPKWTRVRELLEKELTNNTKDILCYVSKAKGLKKYISKDKIPKKNNYWKVITPAAAYKGSSGFSDLYLLNDNEIHSRSYISFKVNNNDEAENLFSYLKCKLPHILLSMRKQTHNLCNSDVFKWIPFVPLDRKWNNTELHKYLNLTEENIKFIECIQLEGTYNK